MTEFWFIRHGESESNAGLPSKSDKSTPLTEKGWLQAKYIAESILHPPDLFIVSPYLRAVQTAEPTLEKFPDTLRSTWPIHEFSYLSHQQYHNTNSKQRGALSRDFFLKSDPNLVLGEGGESFNQFIDRIIYCLKRITTAQEEFIILFGHGWFMRAMLWYLYTQQSSPTTRRQFKKTIQKIVPSYSFVLKMFSLSKILRMKNMYSFLLFSAGVQIPNGGILKLNSLSDENIEILNFDLSHLPENLVKTTLINR